MRRAVLLLVVAILVPYAGGADHDPPPVDQRPNPNCAWDAGRSVDWDGDGQPDHMVAGASHNTSFPNQVMETVVKPLPDPAPEEFPIITWFGANEGPDDVTVVVQGDHRMLGANPPASDGSNPEQLHNGAIYAHVDYDDVENGTMPSWEGGVGIYEADHLVMLCVSSEDDPEAAVCLASQEFVNMSDEDCPTG